MRSKNDYVSIWPDGTRVRLLKEDHRKSGEYATIVRVLPNPSNRFENQWYDVRFYDGVYGRFLGRHLEYIPAAAGAEALAEPAA